jgi:hypothetical protein
VLDKKKLPELGLDEVKRHLEVVVRGETRKYDVGIAMHAQNGEAFLRDARDNRIYLMPRGLLQELAERQAPRRSAAAPLRLEGVRPQSSVSAGGKKRELPARGARELLDRGLRLGEDARTSATQAFKNWHDSLWRTFPMEVLGKGELPKSGTLKPALARGSTSRRARASAGSRSPSSGRLEHERSSDGLDTLYARSEHTVGWTHLHAPDSMVTDAEKVGRGALSRG